jgi:hypothetical protein
MFRNGKIGSESGNSLIISSSSSGVNNGINSASESYILVVTDCQ